MRTKLHDPRLFWREKSRFIQANIRGADGRIAAHSTKCLDERAAVLFANEQERIAANPRYRDAAGATLMPAIEAAQLELQRRKRAPGTIAQFTSKAGHFIRLWGADMLLSKINAVKVEEYIATRESEQGIREGSKVQPVTIKAELSKLSLILKVARHHGLFEEELVKVFPILYSSKHKPRKRWCTLLELQALFSHVEPYHAAHLAFIVASGARRGESQRAERTDVDWARGVVRVRGTKTEGADADVPITILTEPLLRWALANAPNKEGVLFRSWHNLNRDVAAACVRAGIPRVSPNDLRRTLGKWHRNAGVIPSQIAGMLRHTTSKLAETTYATLDGEHLGKLLDGQLGSASKLLGDGGESDASGDVDETIQQEKAAPPARFERATLALGSLLSKSSSALVIAGYGADEVGAGASVLSADGENKPAPLSEDAEEPPSSAPCEPCPLCGPGRVFHLTPSGQFARVA
jgi:integrase